MRVGHFPAWAGVNWSRLIVLTIGVAIAAPCLVVVLTALGLPGFAVHAVAGTVAVGAAVFAHTRAPADLAELDRSAVLIFVLWLVLAVGAVYRVSSLAVFISDVTRVEHAYQRQHRVLDDPELVKPFYLKHNCSTCYLVAAHLADSGTENLYDRRYYRNPDVPTPVHDEIDGAFNVDQYQYPPPFLLGPYLALLTGLDFFKIRALWFAFSVILFVVTSGVITVWICGWRFHALWLIWPALLVSPTIIATLQMGNAHAFMILVAVLAMVAFAGRRDALGGALLAYAALSKFFPGILVLYLLVRRKWRAVGWTAAWAVLLCAATLAIFGPTPFEAFLSHQLPAIASGDAFGFAFAVPGAKLANASVVGIPYKLEKLGIDFPGSAEAVARVLTWLYTLGVLAVVHLAARRRDSADLPSSDRWLTSINRLATARLWLALLVLAQLRSPFLPGVYGNTAILLLLALLLPLDRVSPARLVAVSVGVLAYAVVLPLPIGPASSAFDHAYGIVATLFAAGLAAVVALRQPVTRRA